MTPPDRRALVVTTGAAASARTSGATLRADEVVALLEHSGHAVERTTPDALPRRGCWDLGVVVSYAGAGTLRALRARTGRTWLDAVDSWLLVNGSGLRHGAPSYALRMLRDGARLASAPSADLVTYISHADLRADLRSVRGHVRLVLPGHIDPPSRPPRTDVGPRLVLAGDWDYPPNRDGLQWFADRVLPRVARHLTDEGVPVDVYGPGAALPEAGRLLRTHGYVDDAEVLYALQDVHVAPLRFGAGVKRKVLAPLTRGLPVVTTHAGAHGLRPHPLLDACGDDEAFAAALVARLLAPSGGGPTPAPELADRDDTAAVAAWLRA